jgi:hypothetical protein
MVSIVAVLLVSSLLILGGAMRVSVMVVAVVVVIALVVVVKLALSLVCMSGLAVACTDPARVCMLALAPGCARPRSARGSEWHSIMAAAISKASKRAVLIQ